MSWQDKINSPFTITTGDGSTYTPLWKPVGYEVEYNASVFEFPDIPGALIRRKSPRATKYDFNLYFQGDNHIEDMATFMASAANPGKWKVQHPYYGTIYVQPMGISVNHQADNVSEFGITCFATIDDSAPNATVSRNDAIISKKATTDAAMNTAYENSVVPKAADIVEMKSKTKKSFDFGVKAVTDEIEKADFRQAFVEANRAINSATSAPGIAIAAIQNVLNAPYKLTSNLDTRLNALKGQLKSLIDSISTIAGLNSKRLFEHNGGSLVSGIAAATATDTTIFSTRKEVLSVIDVLSNSFNGYLTALDIISTATAGDAGSYIADSVSITKLSELVSFTISSLLKLADTTSVEQSVILTEDSTVIQLAHKYYGLAADDSTIDKLIETNDIGLNELLIVPKGRQIKYYTT